MRPTQKGRKGFTLIELIVVIAILGILAAIAVPNLVRLLGRGGPTALEADQSMIQLAVDSFYSDTHTGPDSTGRWGKGSRGFWYPTKTGQAGNLELNPTQTHNGNPRVDLFLAGPGTGGAATDAAIADALVWMGLLVNEASGTSSGTLAENLKTGDAHPLAGEGARYLQAFPRSAAEANADTDNWDNNPVDTNSTNGNGYSKGSYYWIILNNGRVVPAYKSGTSWYAGFKGVYP